jgi:hypothetical protein
MLHGAGIFTYIHDWAILGVNVGKYSSTMEHMSYRYNPPKNE